MTNEEIALEFEQIADLLEIKGESAFRVNNYRRAARTIDDLNEEIDAVAARNELNALPGVGKSIAAKIQELLDSGSLSLRAEITDEIPESVLTLLEIPGLGPKKAALLWQKKSIADLDQLQAAIDDGDLNDLKGFGPKTIASILAGIEFLKRSAGRARLGDVLPAAQKLRDYLAQSPSVQRAELAGSIRRGCETVADVNLVCQSDDPAQALDSFKNAPGAGEILESHDDSAALIFEVQPRKTIRADLHVVAADRFGAAWQYFTGSKKHNAKLAERAADRGLKLDPNLAMPAEEDLYHALDLACFPPELREDSGEIEAAAPPADLITPQDIRGDLHMHTVASDGRGTVAEMAQAAHALGYQYICITDHSYSSSIANGLNPERLLALAEEVRQVDAKFDDLQVWIGTEVDVRADGSLDYDDQLLQQLDFVVASIHAGLSKDLKTNTDRTLAAIHNPYVNAVGHPTGRMINARKPMKLDMDEIFRAAVQTGTALEINAGPYRLDLKDEHARIARDLGVTLVISTDAHGPEKLERISYGLTVARRAALRKQDVLNTRTPEQIRQFVQDKRDRV